MLVCQNGLMLGRSLLVLGRLRLYSEDAFFIMAGSLLLIRLFGFVLI